jgi:hypothetical protein
LRSRKILRLFFGVGFDVGVRCFFGVGRSIGFVHLVVRRSTAAQLHMLNVGRVGIGALGGFCQVERRDETIGIYRVGERLKQLKRTQPAAE